MSEFDKLQTGTPSSSKTKRRAGQRDVLPLATKYRLSEFYDAKNNNIDFADDDGNSVFKIELANGTVTFGTNVKFSAAITKGISPSSFVQEIVIPITFAGSSGGDNVSFFTDSTTYKNLSDGEFIFDPGDYPGVTFNLEIVGRAGADGDPSRTLSAQLYNVTTSTAITSSLAETTETSAATITDPGSFIRFRSGNTTFTSGSNTYILQFKTDVGGRFVDLQRAALIIRY